ncbi:GNAT family N-acetyltransferase [Pelagibacterium sp.]|uniref:GNAT family N-acetyltransferase n=1 Tax=Pelagibacterium sp. TaxID=1967288 RepID=UPI003A940CA0
MSTVFDTVQSVSTIALEDETIPAAGALPGGAEWRALVDGSAEPNPFYTPEYLGALSAADGAKRPRIVSVRRENGVLCALVPMISAWTAYRLPVAAHIAHFPYIPFGTPSVLSDDPTGSARRLIEHAASLGLSAMVFPFARLDGPTAEAIEKVLAAQGLSSRVINRHERAVLDATGDAETYLRAGMGSKKLKDLRRLRHRLDEMGTVSNTIARTPKDVGSALARFLELEARGWKGEHGSGLGQSSGDRTFIERAAVAMAAHGQFEIVEMWLDTHLLATGIVLRAGRTAVFFKTAYDEEFAKFSPGVQLTVELTRQFCADPGIDFADSSAAANHPMIERIWRERICVGDLIVPTRGGLGAKLAIAVIFARAAARARAKQIYLYFRNFKR